MSDSNWAICMDWSDRRWKSVSSPAGPYMYAEALESDEKELKKLERADSYEKMSEVLMDFN